LEIQGQEGKAHKLQKEKCGEEQRGLNEG
jgi:hypothetical protein